VKRERERERERCQNEREREREKEREVKVAHLVDEREHGGSSVVTGSEVSASGE
jgi:hypothetical protein